jgi:hypothetical protein
MGQDVMHAPRLEMEQEQIGERQTFGVMGYWTDARTLGARRFFHYSIAPLLQHSI